MRNVANLHWGSLAGARCHCGEPIWVIGSVLRVHACFTLHGEADPSEDYEIDEVLKPVEPRSRIGSQAVVNVDSWWDGLSRDRFQAVLELVLDAIAEDYVTVEIISKNINEWDGERDPASWAARSAAPVSRPEIIHALRELTREGYAQAASSMAMRRRVVKFRPDQLADVWFCATEKGINAVRKFLGEE